MSDGLFAFLVLLACPALFGALLWLLVRLEHGADDPSHTPFDPPRWFD